MDQVQEFFKVGENLVLQNSDLFSLLGSEVEDYKLDTMLFTSCKYGGPFALTTEEFAVVPKDQKHESPLNHICLFQNNGKIMKKYPKLEIKGMTGGKSQIIAIDFLEDETLVAVLKDGFVLLDPVGKKPKVIQIKNYLKDKEFIEGAKAVDMGIVFYTNLETNLRFHYILNFFQEDCKPSPFTWTGPDALNLSNYHSNLKLFFLPISSDHSLSNKLECFVNDHNAGIIRLVEGEKDKLDFANHPTKFSAENHCKDVIPEVKLMALSTKGFGDNKLDAAKLAVLNNQGAIFVFSLKFPITNFQLFKADMSNAKDGKEMNLHWAGINCLVVVQGNQYWPISTLGKAEAKKKTIRDCKQIFCAPEIDGLRIISNKKCEILRELSDEYKGIKLWDSKKSSKDLYEAYRENEERKPSPTNKILQNKPELENNAIKECIEAAAFELNIEQQKELLKAAAFGKSFLPPTSQFRHDLLPDTCKKLRVLNSLRGPGIARAMTYQQFMHILDQEHGETILVDTLLKYNLFYLADEIAKYLAFSGPITSHIYINWACAKIDNDEPFEKISSQIYERLKNDKSISFVEIAHRAFERGKTELAKKLMDYETSVYKKVPVLIWLGEIQKGLDDACNSNDPNLIDLVIFRMMKDESKMVSVIPHLLKMQRAYPRLYRYMKEFYYTNDNIPLNEKGLPPANEIKAPPPAKGAKKETKEFRNDTSKIDGKTYLFYMAYAKDIERICFTVWRCYFERKESSEKMLRTSDELSVSDKIELIKQLKGAVKFKDDLKIYEDIFNMMEENFNIVKLSNQPEEKPILTRVLEEVKNATNAADAIQKKFKISDRLMFATKVRGFAENPTKENLERLELLLKNKNKSGDLMNFTDLAILLHEKGLNKEAEAAAIKIKDYDMRYLVLKSICTTTSLKHAVEAAIHSKNPDRVQEIENFLNGQKTQGKVKIDDECFSIINKFHGGK
jgi:hypothetical protein